jgi:hypothetical protein
MLLGESESDYVYFFLGKSAVGETVPMSTNTVYIFHTHIWVLWNFKEGSSGFLGSLGMLGVHDEPARVALPPHGEPGQETNITHPVGLFH